jgi:RNA polymerase sigma-70 factor (ECF subfamily)
MPIPDKTIIDGCIKGKPGAWEEFVQRFSGLVIWAIRDKLSRAGLPFTQQDTEDIHQEVFLAVSNKIKSLKDPSRVAPWLCVISSNAALNYMKNKGRINIEAVSSSEEGGGRALIETLASGETSIAQRLDEKLKKQIVTEAIETLAPKEKIVLNLHLVHENTISEVAQILDMQQGTVSSIVKRAKDKIKEYLNTKNI